MRHRAVVSVAVSACLSAACVDEEARPSRLGPGPTFTQVFVSPPNGGDVPYPSEVQPFALPVSAHLEGQLRDIRLSGGTPDNYASLRSPANAPAFVGMSVAMVGSPAGAGMLILNINGGLDHPAFTEGTWSSERELEYQMTTSYSGEQMIYVGSCAGPALGDYPFEQQAVDYDMTLEDDPEVPGSVVIVVGASFYADDFGMTTSDLTGTIRFARSE